MLFHGSLRWIVAWFLAGSVSRDSAREQKGMQRKCLSFYSKTFSSGGARWRDTTPHLQPLRPPPAASVTGSTLTLKLFLALGTTLSLSLSIYLPSCICFSLYIEFKTPPEFPVARFPPSLSPLPRFPFIFLSLSMHSFSLCLFYLWLSDLEPLRKASGI